MTTRDHDPDEAAMGLPKLERAQSSLAQALKDATKPGSLSLPPNLNLGLRKLTLQAARSRLGRRRSAIEHRIENMTGTLDRLRQHERAIKRRMVRRSVIELRITWFRSVSVVYGRTFLIVLAVLATGSLLAVYREELSLMLLQLAEFIRLPDLQRPGATGISK